MIQEDLTMKLKDRNWRLNNLYWIKNEQGLRIKFKLNWAQQYLLENLWYLNVILKARQLGITTFFCILYLDDVIFNGFDAGLIAHTFPDATKIFDTKVKYAWDNLPLIVKNQYELNAENTRELQFKKGNVISSIYVGTSLRSGTVQRLHISEMGTIDQKYPNKSEEIKSGALNTVHAGQIVTIESTAKGQTGVFFDVCNEALILDKSNKELTEMDYRIFFFPWWKHPQYQLSAEMVLPREIQDYFQKLEEAEGIQLLKEQKNWYYKKKQTQKEAMKTEFPSTPAEAFQANIEGAYFGKQMDKVMDAGRIMKVPYDPLLLVDTYWDIGTDKKKTDSNSIIFVQRHGLEVRIIDFYGNSGEGLAHYKKVLDDKPYAYGNHYGPHDLEVKELGTGKTRLEVATGLGINFTVLPRLPFLDGIEAARAILPKCWFDEEKTGQLVKALLSFRKEWDDKLGKFKDQPLKDWSSDPADAFRMLGIGHKDLTIASHDKEEEELQEIRDRQAGGFDPTNPFADI